MHDVVGRCTGYPSPQALPKAKRTPVCFTKGTVRCLQLGWLNGIETLQTQSPKRCVDRLKFTLLCDCIWKDDKLQSRN